MKVKTNNALIIIEPENDIEKSFLCLWEAALSDLLTHESLNSNLLESLLYLSSGEIEESK